MSLADNGYDNVDIEKHKTCYNCKNYDSENDWCEKHHGKCEAWRHIGQEYTCCELAESKSTIH